MSTNDSCNGTNKVNYTSRKKKVTYRTFTANKTMAICSREQVYFLIQKGTIAGTVFWPF